VQAWTTANRQQFATLAGVTVAATATALPLQIVTAKMSESMDYARLKDSDQTKFIAF
jgi:hypothetical protein